MFGENVTSPVIFVPLCNQIRSAVTMDGEHDKVIDSPSSIVTDLNDLITVSPARFTLKTHNVHVSLNQLINIFFWLS